MNKSNNNNKQQYYYPLEYNKNKNKSKKEDTHSSFHYESYNKTCINNECAIEEHDQCKECVTRNGRTTCRHCT